MLNKKRRENKENISKEEELKNKAESEDRELTAEELKNTTGGNVSPIQKKEGR